MPVLLLIWRFAKPLLPYIAVILFVVGLLSAYGHREYGRGKTAEVAKYQPAMDRATARMAKAMRALKDADDAIKLQNASILAHAKAEQAALANASKIRAEADKRDIGRKAQIVSLTAAAARPIAGPPCDSIAEVKDSWK